jgi:hypothetical protein
MNFIERNLKRRLIVPVASLLCAAGNTALAQTSIYRCPGNPVMYTSDQRLAQSKNCTLAGAGDAVSRTRRRSMDVVATAQGSASNGSVTKVASLDSTARTASPEQKARDSDRLTILTTELREEKTKFEALKQKLASTSASGSASDGVGADLTKALARSQSDINALEREISRAQ